MYMQYDKYDVYCKDPKRGNDFGRLIVGAGRKVQRSSGMDVLRQMRVSSTAGLFGWWVAMYNCYLRVRRPRRNKSG